MNKLLIILLLITSSTYQISYAQVNDESEIERIIAHNDSIFYLGLRQVSSDKYGGLKEAYVNVDVSHYDISEWATLNSNENELLNEAKEYFNEYVITEFNKAGIKLLKHEEAAGKPYFSLTINTFVAPMSGTRNVNISVRLSERVSLERDPKRIFSADTYNMTGDYSYEEIDEQTMNMIMVSAKGYIDEFIRMYLIANPK